MRNKELKVTQEFTNLFNDELVIYKNILVKGRSKITFYNYIIVTRKGIFAITTKTINSSVSEKACFLCKIILIKLQSI